MRDTTLGPAGVVGAAAARVRAAATLGFIATAQLSIALSQALLGVAAAAWVTGLVGERRLPTRPRIWMPLGGYAAATLVSAAFSLDPAASFADCKQLLLFAVVLLVHDGLDGAARARASALIVLAGVASAVVGVVEFGWLGHNSIDSRPNGLLGHYMTYSGGLMLSLAVALGRMVSRRPPGASDIVAVAMLLGALLLTFTRGAWLGAIAAAAILLALHDARWLVSVPLVAALLFGFVPSAVQWRMRAVFSAEDRTSRERLLMAASGLRIVRDHPLVGVGPGMIERVYPRYRLAGATDPAVPHLHNNVVQIAAERGLPALALWLWFVVRVLGEEWRLVRRGRAEAGTALAGLVAVLVAGLFEYNVGDSEVLVLLLVIVTLPIEPNA